MTNDEVLAEVERIQNEATGATKTLVQGALAVPPATVPDAAQQAILNAIAMLNAILVAPPTP